MDVEMDKNADVIIVDLGYLTEQAARDRADALLAAGVSKRNLIWGPSTAEQRIHINIPPRKQQKILSQFPIEKKKTWFGANYSWLTKKTVEVNDGRSELIRLTSGGLRIGNLRIGN